MFSISSCYSKFQYSVIDFTFFLLDHQKMQYSYLQIGIWTIGTFPEFTLGFFHSDWPDVDYSHVPDLCYSFPDPISFRSTRFQNFVSVNAPELRTDVAIFLIRLRSWFLLFVLFGPSILIFSYWFPNDVLLLIKKCNILDHLITICSWSRFFSFSDPMSASFRGRIKFPLFVLLFLPGSCLSLFAAQCTLELSDEIVHRIERPRLLLASFQWVRVRTLRVSGFCPMTRSASLAFACYLAILADERTLWSERDGP